VTLFVSFYIILVTGYKEIKARTLHYKMNNTFHFYIKACKYYLSMKYLSMKKPILGII